MRPPSLKTKIFLDSGDPQETHDVIGLLGFLDGQTTNPTLVAKSPDVQKYLAGGKKLTEKEVYGLYREIVTEISGLIPDGSVSIEVYADKTTLAGKMLEQGREMFSWIPNAHIKFPLTGEGLKASEKAIRLGMRVNMTLCFSEEQAAAVYAATKGAKRGDVFLSPFVGRLDDIGENGMDLIKNIITMYHRGDGHMEILTASVRNLNHFFEAVRLGSDIITAPAKILREWAEKGIKLPDENFSYGAGGLQSIPYKEIDLLKDWRQYDISHALTDNGIARFAQDWNALIAKNQT